jgi:hypothetical protein
MDISHYEPFKNKILNGTKKAIDNLIKESKSRGLTLVISIDGKIQKISPSQLEIK